jgi:uncharacterized protein YyaL (SSP411 family)
MQPGVNWAVRLGLPGLLAFATCACSAGDDPPGKEKGRSTNRLAKETSPYLLLHAHNPVDWYPWGPEAFARAKAENKPIFLSVGYSSCYWCHVMERESFMDEAIAKVLNAGYVCIKVDREERPDVDQIYMAALQALGPGGWPMSMFLTPDGRPFFGGTYFPSRDRDGSPGFQTIVTEVARAWGKDRAGIEKAADAVTEALRGRLKVAAAARKAIPSRTAIVQGEAQLAEQFDREYGGFGFNPANPKRPKFPEPVNLVFLLEQHRRGGPSSGGVPALEMVTFTLDRMARGGIRDHLAGGYHRYATDRRWIVPHFEKMLYDNAQLASVHLAVYEITKDERWRAEAEATFGFVEAKLTSPEGGFYSALDAETKGEEGKYYVWTPDEVKAALGESPDAAAFSQVYGLVGEPTAEGGHYVLHEPRTRSEQAAALKLSAEDFEARLLPLLKRLLAAREKRPAPLLDDKILTAWNGLMIAAYADGFRVLKDAKYRQSAEKAARFVLKALRTKEGRLLRTYRAGSAKIPAYLEDYAFLAFGLLRLHQATGEAGWLREAQSVVDRMLADFEDKEDGGFFFTATDHEQLLARAKDPFDNALPSGNSVAVLDLLVLYRNTHRAPYLEQAGKALASTGSAIAQIPAALPLTLVGLGQYLDERPEAGTEKLDPGGSATDPADRIITATIRAERERQADVVPGGEFAAIVKIAIKPGWHIYANPTGVAELNPTKLEVHPESRKIVSMNKAGYPAGVRKVLASSGKDEVSLFEKEVEVRAECVISKDAKPGSVVLKFQLSYQACNDSLCREAQRIELPLSLTIGSENLAK